MLKLTLPTFLRRTLVLAVSVGSTFAVNAQTNVLTSGRANIGVHYNPSSAQWNLNVRDETGAVTYSPATNAVLWIEPIPRRTVPPGPEWSFLGNAGSNVWILPKIQTANLLWLGVDTSTITNGVFASNQFTLTLQSVAGPGHFALYDVDAAGNALVRMNTRDGITALDAVVLPVGAKSQFNWAFSAPGDYLVRFAAGGTFTNGTAAPASPTVDFRFHVEREVYHLTFQHMDFRPEYQPNAQGTNRMDTVVRHDVTVEVDPNGRQIATNKYFSIVGATNARVIIPNNPTYTFLGPPGAPIWILPQSQVAGLPYAGISTEEIQPGIFSNPLRFELRDVDGPGNFFAYQALSFSQADIEFIWTNGVASPDHNTMLPDAGGHVHYNWAFSTNGLYRVTFRYSGDRISDSEEIVGKDVTWEFRLLPLRPYESWITTNWLPATPSSVVGPGIDPDGDGIVNLFEYVLGNDPNVAARTNLPTVTFVTVGGTNYGALSYARATNATDVTLSAVAASSVTGAPWVPLTNIVSVVADGKFERVTVRDWMPRGQTTNRFYQLRGSLNYP